jgi:cell wall-associated NlpC family hydrolase
MEITADVWLGALRKYAGVPFLHQGRTTAGLDCIGLLVVAGHDLGIRTIADNIMGYARAPDSRLFETKTNEILVRRPYNRLQGIKGQLVPGDIMIFWIDRVDLPRHVAVYTGENRYGDSMFIHAYAKKPRTVVEMPIDVSYWQTRLHGVWCLPQLKE